MGEQHSMISAHRHHRHLYRQIEQSWDAISTFIILLVKVPEIFAQSEDSPVRCPTQGHSPVSFDLLHVRVQHAHHDCGAVMLHNPRILQLFLLLESLHLV